MLLWVLRRDQQGVVLSHAAKQTNRRLSNKSVILGLSEALRDRGVCVQVPQSCLTLYDSKDCCLPGPSVHGIIQVRILECAAIPGVPKCEWMENGQERSLQKRQCLLGLASLKAESGRGNRVPCTSDLLRDI